MSASQRPVEAEQLRKEPPAPSPDDACRRFEIRLRSGTASRSGACAPRPERFSARLVSRRRVCEKGYECKGLLGPREAKTEDVEAVAAGNPDEPKHCPAVPSVVVPATAP